MAQETPSPAAVDFIAKVEQAYRRLIESHMADPDMGLGGRLLYAGELDGEGRALVAGANIAGAATLAAIADRAAQKQAIRDGIADFLVNSLDESLRILKNQLRKRETVAVCVGLSSDAIEGEMQERGVQPDLLRVDALPQVEAHRAIASAESTIVLWSVASAPAQWLPKLDAIALDCIEPDQWQSRQWVRLAPRYLGRLAGGARMLRCGPQSATKFIEQVRDRVSRGEVSVAVEVQMGNSSGKLDTLRFAPGEPGQRL